MSAKKFHTKVNIHKLSPNDCRIKKQSYMTIVTDVFRSIKDPCAAIIWTFLIGHPDNWTVQKQHIKNQYGFSIRKIEDKFRYLEKMGLMSHTQVKSSDGRFVKHLWEVHGEPITTMLENDIVEETPKNLCTEPLTDGKSTMLVFHTVEKRPLIYNKDFNYKKTNYAEDKKIEEITTERQVMTVNYKSDIVNECKYVHQEKQFGAQGYYCTNPAQSKLMVRDSTGKIFEFEVCPRHENMAISRGEFNYCHEILQVVKKENQT